MFAYAIFWLITSFGLIGCFQLHWAAGLAYLTPYLIAHGLCVGAFKPEKFRPTHGSEGGENAPMAQIFPTRGAGLERLLRQRRAPAPVSGKNHRSPARFPG